MEDSPGASKKLCGLIGGNGMIMADKASLHDACGQDEGDAIYACENQPKHVDLAQPLFLNTEETRLFRALGSLTFGKESGAAF